MVHTSCRVEAGVAVLMCSHHCTLVIAGIAVAERLNPGSAWGLVLYTSPITCPGPVFPKEL